MKTILLALAVCVFWTAACGGKATAPAPPDGGPVDGGCVVDPHTNLEILNACTDAGYLDKSPTLPLLLPDGGLPDLP